jgi:hypothetical protein
MVLYVAADSPLPEVLATTPLGLFSARPIKGAEEAVRARFTKPHVYFLGAHEGCSCGFSYGLGDDGDERGRESVRRLRAYLDAAVAQGGAVEIYACWVDEEAEPAMSSQTIGTDQFTGDAEAFELPKRWYATVIAPAS